MADLSDERRDRIHALLQELGPPGDDVGSLLTGWVMLTSWVDPNGTPWLARGYAAEVPFWAAKGMLHQGLYGEWPDPDDDDG